MTIGLAAEMLVVVEGDGNLCRDDGRCVISEERERDMVVLGEVRWWCNFLEGYVWDGQE